MPADGSWIPFAPSRRTAPPGERVGDPDPAAQATVTLYLRAAGAQPAPGRLSREGYASAHGARTQDVEAVRRFAAAQRLSVASIHPERRSVELSGTVAALSAAFAVSLGLYHDGDGRPFRGREGTLSLPPELHPLVAGVFGLDERPQARSQFRPRADASSPHSPTEIAAAYRYPAGLDGGGECVALIELGGGFRSEDLSAYFASLGLAPPSVEAVPVGQGANDPGNANGPDGEVMLDIEVVGAIAPRATIAVYFAPNTDQGFIDAVNAAVHDAVRKPSVVSISWGGPESSWTSQATTQLEQAFSAAAAMGVTVTVAAGDNGSSDGVSDGRAHVDFPASAPHALGCGGTRLELDGSSIGSETVWNDGSSGGAGGGGVSDVFALPSFQAAAGVPPSANPGGRVGRGVPDVCGDADPDTGYLIRVDGQSVPIGGTSAVAPLWAALVALLNQGLGHPVGFLNPFLYSEAARGRFNDVVSGSNGAYAAGPGWDACSGLGSPDGARLLSALQAAARG